MYYQQRIRNVVSLLIMSMLCLASFAQGLQVQGIVKDKNGEPMIGVNVVVKGTTNGTITGIDGDFSLSGVKKSDVIAFTYIGFKNKEVKYEGQKQLNVILEEDTETLEEVVVIGYGTVNKRDLTGSVASVSAEDIAAVPVSSATEALTGKLAGVNITTTEGSPDADVKIRVRGGGSLSQDNSPLYIVDGFPVSSISDIAPSEIQSIDVLKDASSTAIYGARGANGVIIVTTKSGTEGKTQVDFGASFGLKKVTKLTKVLSPYDYVAYQHELGSTDYGNYSDMDIWKSVEGYDYQDDIFGRTGNQAQYNVNVSGGSKQVKYNVSYAHNDEKSIMLGSGFNKNNINAKINAELSQWMTLDFNARMSYTTVDGLSGGADTNESSAANSIVANAARFRPVDPLTSNSDDEENNTSSQKNPLERLLATYKKRNTFNQNYNVGLNWKPFKNWTFRSEFGYGWKYDNTDQVWASDAVQNSKLGYNGQPQSVLTRDITKNWRNANTLTYDNKKLFDGRDKLNVLLGHEVSSSQETSLENTSVAFPGTMTIDEVLANMGAGTALPTQTTISAKDNMLSFFGRVNYTLMDKYLLTVTVRADGSSKFAKGNQWGVFPSAALAWRLSDEAFMKGTQDWLSNLKVRLSYGTAGNNRISSGLMYTTYTMAGNTGKAPFFDETRGAMLEHGSNLYNPNLKWETTTSWNFGFDFGFLKDRITGSLDYYTRKTKDLIATVPAAAGSTFDRNITTNVGNVDSQGIELSLNATPVQTKDLTWDVSFNMTWQKMKVKNLSIVEGGQATNTQVGPAVDGQYVQTLSEGYEPYMFYVYKQLYDEKNGKPIEGAYADLNNDGTINEGDLYRYHSPAPDFIMGLSTSLQWKRWNLGMSFRANIGNYVYNGMAMTTGAFETMSYNAYQLNNLSTSYLETGFQTRQHLSDHYVENASFLKMDNLTLGYNFGEIFKGCNLNVSAMVQNVFCITKYSGVDPEVPNGVDNTFYPRPRTYSLNIGLNF